MMLFLVFTVMYFIILLVLGFLAQRRTKKSPEEYFLAGRSFGTIILFFSLAATNFSAFTFLGFAGKAYTSGFGQYGIMAFGTGFMAIMFFIIGRKVWILGKEKEYMTPAELVGGRFHSVHLQLLFMGVLVMFTIPYLATQAIGAGLLIEYVTEGAIIWKIGAILTMLIIMIYVLFGGMRGSGWTDVLQGLIMIVALVVAVSWIVTGLGGIEQANLLSAQADSSLFSRPGPTNFFTPQIWFSFLLLWLFADPMFPQIFSRFYTAKNEKSLKHAMILYPVLVSFLFLIPVLIGVWAHGANLQINAAEVDMVLPMMVELFAPTAVFFFVMIGALAALMSTADSQLLSLSTMLARDIPFSRYKKISQVDIGRIFVIILSLFAVFFVISGYDPSVGIMGTLVSTTFSGLAVLCPVVLAVLYWSKATEISCMLAIIAGEVVVFLSQYTSWSWFGFLPALWGVAIASIVLIGCSYLQSFIKSSYGSE